MNFNSSFSMMFNIMSDGKGGALVSGTVYQDNSYDPVVACKLNTSWNSLDHQSKFNANLQTEGGKHFDIEAKVHSLIPLRNRRKLEDGRVLLTRIAEGMTEYRCNGLIGYGMSEYLDQIVDGKPIGRELGH